MATNVDEPFDEDRWRQSVRAQALQDAEHNRLFALHEQMTEQYVMSLHPHVVEQLNIIMIEDAEFEAAHRAMDSRLTTYFPDSGQVTQTYWNHRDNRLQHLAEIAGLHRNAFIDWLASRARRDMLDNLLAMEDKDD